MLYFNNLKELREKRNLTQKIVANDLKMYLTTYTRYERGEQDLPLHTAILIANYYDISLDNIAGLKKTIKPEQFVLHEDKPQTTK